MSARHPKIVRLRSTLLAAAALAAVGRPTAALADTFTWTAGSPSGGYIDLGANWQNSSGVAAAPPNDASANLVFGTVGNTYTPTNRYGANVRSIAFTANASAGGSGYSLAAQNGVGLTLGAGGIADNAALGMAVQQPLLLSADQTWNASAASGSLAVGGAVNTNGFRLTGAGSGSVTISGTISGFGGLTVAGPGVLALGGANTYAGGTTLAGGTLSLTSGGAIPSTGPITFAGGLLQYTAGNTTDYSARFASTGPGFSIDTNGRTVTFASPLSGPAGITKLGAGTLSLSAASTYAGYTTVSAGTLAIVTGGGLGTLLADVTVDGAAAGKPTLSVGGGADGSGATIAVATLTVGNSATGTLVQSGGTVSSPYGGLAAGYNAGSTGTYVLAGGTLADGGVTAIGYSGTGTFNQSGGAFTSPTASVGVGVNNGGSGTINLTGGTFNAGELDVAGSPYATGSVNQSGGNAVAPSVILTSGTFANGTYTLGGGILTTSLITAHLRKGQTQFGVGAFHFNGGTLQASNNSATFITNLATADVGSGGARIDTNGYDVTITQSLLHAAGMGSAADGGLTKVGAGTLTLSAAAAYTGPTNVSAGTLVFAADGPLATSGIRAAAGSEIDYAAPAGLTVSASLSGTGVQRVLSGTATFNGGAMYNGVNLVLQAPTTLNQVTSAAAINVTAGTNLTWQDGSNALGTLAVNGTANVSGWTSTGIVTVASGGTLANAATALVLGGGSRTYVDSGGSLSTPAGTTVEVDGSLLVNNGTVRGTVDANFGSLITGSGSFSVPVVVNPGGTYAPGAYGAASPGANTSTPLAYVQPAATGATTAASPVTVNADAVVTVNGTDVLTLAGGLAAAGHAVTKFGTGTLAVTPFTASALNVAAGSVRLTPSPAASLMVVPALTIGPAAELDLTTGALDVSSGSLSALTALVAAGFNGGAWNGLGGIVSSVAAADASHLTALGVIPNTVEGSSQLYSSFEGQAVGAADVLARYTFYGDTNLDGSVTAADYTRVDAGFVGHLSGWANGDFNYDGTVDGSDYALIDNAFNQQTGGVATAADVVSVGTTAVPEPAAAAGLLLVIAGVGRRSIGTRRR